jgi:hypothetical protein
LFVFFFFFFFLNLPVLLCHSCMSSNEAVDFLTKRPDAFRRCLDQLPLLTWAVDIPSLISLVKYVDPSRPLIRSLFPG